MLKVVNSDESRSVTRNQHSLIGKSEEIKFGFGFHRNMA